MAIRRRTGVISRGLQAGLLLSLYGATPSAGLELYRFIDGQGVVHFTNLAPVDQRFRPVSLPLRGFLPGSNLRSVPVYRGYDVLIERVSRRHQVEPGLVKAVVAAESMFDADAVSRRGARGLMQLMPATARELGVDEPFDPEQNLLGGVRYLRGMIDRYDDLQLALAAYNAGPEAVDRYRGVPPYAETRDYVARVLNYYRQYDGQFRR